MSNKIKEMLKSILLQFDGVQTDKGMLTWNGDKQLEVGDEVFIDEKPAPDGDYVVDDKVFEVENGKVKEIKVKEMDYEKPENLETEPEKPAEPSEPESKEDKPAPDEKDQKIAELENKVAELENKLADIIARIEKVESVPVVEPVVEEFDQINKKNSTGNKTVDKYSRIFGSK